jgi:hypothetical protein
MRHLPVLSSGAQSVVMRRMMQEQAQEVILRLFPVCWNFLNIRETPRIVFCRENCRVLIEGFLTRGYAESGIGL